MTYQKELLTEKLPELIVTESWNKGVYVYAREKNEIAVGDYHLMHRNIVDLLTPYDELQATKPIVEDGGLLTDNGDYLSISGYTPQSISMRVFRKQHANLDARNDEFNRIRMETAKQIAMKLKKKVRVTLTTGEVEVSPQ